MRPASTAGVLRSPVFGNAQPGQIVERLLFLLA
jgi:hypothetical protein